jgi:predicted nucleotidyltransferase
VLERELAQQVSDLLHRHRERPVCAWVFGSRARGDASPGSDLDVAVLYRDDPPRTLEGLHLELADDLAEAMGLPVDLVVMNRAPADLAHRVLRDGVLLFDDDPSARIRFEVRSRNAWFDLRPHLDRYRAARREGRR